MVGKLTVILEIKGGLREKDRRGWGRETEATWSKRGKSGGGMRVVYICLC